MRALEWPSKFVFTPLGSTIQMFTAYWLPTAITPKNKGKEKTHHSNQDEPPSPQIPTTPPPQTSPRDNTHVPETHTTQQDLRY